MIKLFDKDMNEINVEREMYQWDVFPLDNFCNISKLFDISNSPLKLMIFKKSLKKN